jgi:hypothetical protein
MNVQSFWFTLDMSCDHGCHLARQFRLNPEEYEVLLIVASLASYTRFGFTIKATAWSNFIKGHQFFTNNSAIEFNQKYVDIDAFINGTAPSRQNRRKIYIIRIGNKTEQSANKNEEQTGRDGQLITTPHD